MQGQLDVGGDFRWPWVVAFLDPRLREVRAAIMGYGRRYLDETF